MKKKVIKRRKFIEMAMIGTGSLGLGSFTLNLSSHEKLMGANFKPGKIALQLWTVREEIAIDPQGTLNRIAEIGYPAVETAFWPEEITIEKGAKMLSSAGLKVCSVHIDLPSGENKNQLLEIADAYNCNYLIWHGWPEDARYKSPSGTHKLARMYNEANEWAKDHQLKFGIHNHWWEFEPQASGRLAIDVLRDNLSPDIFFEIDTYWATVAGQNAAEIVGRFAGSAPFLHIKDGPARFTELLDSDEPEPMVSVGKGKLDFPQIVRSANGNTQWMVVELDRCATDMMVAVKESYDFLIENKLAVE